MLSQVDPLASDVESKQVAWRSCPEVLRIALSAVYTRGASFRRQLMKKALDPVAAPPFEIGLDPRPVVYLAAQVEKNETGHRITCGSLLVLPIFGLLFGLPSTFFILVFVVAALLCGIHYSLTQSSLDRFSKAKFSLKTADELLNEWHPKALDFGIGAVAQRTLVYKDFDPFRFAGLPIGKWSFTVDVGKAAQTASGKAELTTVSALELESTIKRKILQSGFGAIVLREVLAVRGEDALILPMVSHEPDIKQPNVLLNDNEVRQLCSKYPNLCRSYLLFHDIRWDGELILTHAVRTSLQGRIFYIETSKFALTPPSKDFKIIDRKRFQNKLGTQIALFIGCAIASPLLVVAETFNLLAGFAVWGSTSRSKKEYLSSLENDPIYNYGANESTRRQIMDDKFDHFSQKADLDFAVKAFDQTIVELIYDYMEEHGVDVSDLRSKVMTIYNSGILVQGGDVTAQAMAVGQGSTAQANTVPKNPLSKKAHAS